MMRNGRLEEAWEVLDDGDGDGEIVEQNGYFGVDEGRKGRVLKS